jgi:hypothetical protein
MTAQVTFCFKAAPPRIDVTPSMENSACSAGDKCRTDLTTLLRIVSARVRVATTITAQNTNVVCNLHRISQTVALLQPVLQCAITLRHTDITPEVPSIVH